MVSRAISRQLTIETRPRHETPTAAQQQQDSPGAQTRGRATVHRVYSDIIIDNLQKFSKNHTFQSGLVPALAWFRHGWWPAPYIYSASLNQPVGFG
jgi:hypothetical protein